MSVSSTYTAEPLSFVYLHTHVEVDVDEHDASRAVDLHVLGAVRITMLRSAVPC